MTLSLILKLTLIPPTMISVMVTMRFLFQVQVGQEELESESRVEMIIKHADILIDPMILILTRFSLMKLDINWAVGTPFTAVEIRAVTAWNPVRGRPLCRRVQAAGLLMIMRIGLISFTPEV